MALLLQGPAPWSIVGSPPVRLEGRTPVPKRIDLRDNVQPGPNLSQREFHTKDRAVGALRLSTHNQLFFSGCCCPATVPINAGAWRRALRLRLMALSRGRVARLTCRAVPLDGEQCSPAGARFQARRKKSLKTSPFFGSSSSTAASDP